MSLFEINEVPSPLQEFHELFCCQPDQAGLQLPGLTIWFSQALPYTATCTTHFSGTDIYEHMEQICKFRNKREFRALVPGKFYVF